jgi:hypothetical protein
LSSTNSGAQSTSYQVRDQQLHGDAFEYYRAALLTRRAISKAQRPSGAARTNRNQAGFDIGAPIIKDRTFIFGPLQRSDASWKCSREHEHNPTAGFAAPANTLRVCAAPWPPDTASRQSVLQSIGFLNDVYKLTHVQRVKTTLAMVCRLKSEIRIFH